MFHTAVPPSAISNADVQLRDKWKCSLKYYGFIGTMANVVGRGFKRIGAFRRLQEWCLRFKEKRFDARFKVDTSEHVPVDQLDISAESKAVACEYWPTSPVRFCSLIAGLGINYRDYDFLDLGSGKGRVLLLASEFPFRQVIGVEIDGTLHQIASRNIASYRCSSRMCQNIQSVCSDVTSYTFPAHPTVMFLYNPFKIAVLTSVLLTLRQSLEICPRHIVVIYLNPIHRSVLDATDFLIDAGWEDNSCAVYESFGPGRNRPCSQMT